MKKLLVFLLVMYAAIILSAGCDCSMAHVDDMNTFPGSLRGEALSSSEARLTWSMPTGESDAKRFSVYRDSEEVESTVNYYFADSGLDASTAYLYQVCIDGQEEKVDGCTDKVIVTTNAAANVFYVDPATGSMANDGSYDHPWRTLQEVFENNLVEMKNYIDHPVVDSGARMEVINPGAPVKGGDVIRLRNGYHGEIVLRGAYNDRFITVEAQDGHAPVLSRVLLSAASRWRLRGLTITQDQSLTGITPQQINLAAIESHDWNGPAHDIIVQGCNLSSALDTSTWTQRNWIDRSCSGIMSSGEDILLEDNYLKNVDFGISIDGNRSFVIGNAVDIFDGDGLRGNAHDLTFEGNLVKNCIDSGNGNHDDGFQSFSVNGAPPWERIVLRGNTIINNDDPALPLRGCLQGIGCFDGWYIDWIVENNLVIVDHWHGISMYGAINCRIVNNTVLNPYPVIDQAHSIWIMVTDHKNGVPSTGCVVRNNISWTMSYSGDTIQDHNILIDDPGTYGEYFIDPLSFDFHLRSDAPTVIDTGSSDLAPIYDFDGNERPAGDAVDPGAYEYVP